MNHNIISWKQAAATAARLAPAGPRLAPEETRAAVESIRYQATASVDHVHRITGLAAAENLHDSQVLVVDRAGWSRANSQTFSMMFNRLLKSGMGERLEHLGGIERRMTEAGTSIELGSVLAFLSSKVLGQYDPFAALGGFGAAGGRLMLVAPNIVMLERELNLDPDDFRLWVCLHEQTHRVQFAAAPWLRDHMLGLMRSLPERMGGGSELVSQLIEGVGEVARSLRSSGTAEENSTNGDAHPAPTVESNANIAADGDEHSYRPVPANRITALLDEESAAIFSQITGIMSLMEGHANVVMNAVDASVVPTIKTIRRRFENRSLTRSPLETIVRKIMGMDLKMRQYREGQRFVQAIVDARGMGQFNRVWERAENLPTEEEIHNPNLWVDRVLGADA